MKKTFQLLIATLLLATSATAQRYRGNARSEKYAPTVYLVSAREVDTVYECCGAAQRLAAMLRTPRLTPRSRHENGNSCRSRARRDFGSFLVCVFPIRSSPILS